MPEPDHADQPTVVLLCGAPGTSISEIAASLGDGDRTLVWDLETEICKNCRETTEQGKVLPVPRMSDVIMRGRRELRSLWMRAYDRIVEGISKSNATTHIVCMHLTWYNAEWQEFYSPINLLNLSADNHSVDHVVILIDDIYDMFCRLHENLHLYDEKNLERAIGAIRKLSSPSDRSLSQPLQVDDTSNAAHTDTDAEAHFEAQLRAQAVESAMVDLLALAQSRDYPSREHRPHLGL